MQFYVDVYLYKHQVKTLPQDSLIQQRNSNIMSSKGQWYFSFKSIFKLEDYLLKLNPSHSNILCKLRTSNHKLPIETGRLLNIYTENRLCPLCQLDVGDEYHYLFICKHFETHRQKLIPRYYVNFPSKQKMYIMLSLLLLNIFYSSNSVNTC